MGNTRNSYHGKVANILSEMGVNSRHKEEREIEERSRMTPAVARLLSEELGMKLRSDQIINENPLDDAGDAPFAGSTGQNDQVDRQDQQVQQQQRQQQGQNPRAPHIKVKDNAGGGNTLDDLSEAMNRISETMRDMETITQTLKKRSNEVSDHKNILRPFLNDIEEAIGPFRRMVE